jgi:hypothetical protein
MRSIGSHERALAGFLFPEREPDVIKSVIPTEESGALDLGELTFVKLVALPARALHHGELGSGEEAEK